MSRRPARLGAVGFRSTSTLTKALSSLKVPLTAKVLPRPSCNTCGFIGPFSSPYKPFIQARAHYEGTSSNDIVLKTLSAYIHEMPPSPLKDLQNKDNYAYHLNDLPAYKHRTGASNGRRRIVVVSSKASSIRAVKSIRAELKISTSIAEDKENVTDYRFLGFDVESKPKFHKGGIQPVAMVQLATQSTAYLFRTKFEGMGKKSRGGGAWTPKLRNLLSDSNIIKVGVNVDGDIKSLRNIYGVNCCNSDSFLDLEKLVRTKWALPPRRLGLPGLTALLLQRRLTKTQRMKNWEKTEMTDAMTEYAAADAFVSLDLLNKISLFGTKSPRHQRRQRSKPSTTTSN